MSLHCESKVVGMDACTIILHADEVEATSFNLDGDTGATRIQAFSMSSLTTCAGRSTTSPAAMNPMVRSSGH